MKVLNTLRALRITLRPVLTLTLVGLVVGCGGAGQGYVTGKVSFNGKPVTGGSLTFSPMAAAGEKEVGRPGTADVKADGTYQVGTNRPGDGVVAGKHKVTYSAPELPYPEGKEPKPGQLRPKSGFEYLAPKSPEVQVKSGTNTIDIELGYPGR
jgi:hypothetical protein